MKVKTLILSVIFGLTFIPAMNAQKGAFDLRFNLGYGFPSAPEYLWNYSTNEDKVILHSFGSGINVDLGGTYLITNNLGAGLDVSYLYGVPTKHDHMYNDVTGTYTYNGTFLSVTPMVVVSADASPINPYGRFGITIASASFTESVTESGNGASSGTHIDKFSGGAALGVYAAFGVEFPVAGNLKMNVELFDRSMNYAPTKAENTQAFDGEKKNADIKFVNKLDPNNSINEELKDFYPFSSFGIKVGLTYPLTGK